MAITIFPPTQQTVNGATLNAVASIPLNEAWTTARIQATGGSGVVLTIEESYSAAGGPFVASPSSTKDSTGLPGNTLSPGGSPDAATVIVLGVQNLQVRVSTPGTGSVTINVVLIRNDGASPSSGGGGVASTVAVSNLANPMPVSGTFYPATQPVSIATAPTTPVTIASLPALAAGTNKIGTVQPLPSATNTTAVPVGAAQVVKASPGTLVAILVTVMGTAPMLIYDSPSAASGTIIGYIAPSAPPGTIMTFLMPAANGIYIPAITNGPAVTVGWS